MTPQKTTNPILIAETAFTHQGEFDYIAKQVKLAAAAKADMVKFQVILEPRTAYFEDSAVFKAIEPWIFTREQWLSIFKMAKELGLKVLVLPIDIPSFEFVKSVEDHVDVVELHSICMNDVFALQQVQSLRPEIIACLGIGGRSIEDIQFAKSMLKERETLLMFGFQSFPTDKKDLNLAKLKELSSLFPNDLLGFADHTPFNEPDKDVMAMSIALGCTYVEKHIVLDLGDESRADYFSAVDQERLQQLRSDIDEMSMYLGTSHFDQLNSAEEVYRDRQRRIVSTADISKGETFSHSNISYKVAEQSSDIPQREILDLMGKTAVEDISIDSVIQRSMVQ